MANNTGPKVNVDLQKVRRPLTVAAATAAVALLLTGCVSGDNKPTVSDKVAGVDHTTRTPGKSARSSASQSRDKPDGVDLSLPEDMELVFDWEKPEDANEAAAMGDAANFFRAIYRGVHKRTTNDAAVATYATGDGLRYAKTQIEVRLEGGWTATGTRRHYNATTRSALNGKSVEIAFCVDSSMFYGKEIESKKILKTEPSLKDFDYFEVVMVKHPTGKDLWQASKVFVKAKAMKCR